MGTVADKLNKLIETKEAIKTSLQNKGVEIADTDTFASYAEKINSIETGGGDLSEYFTETISGTASSSISGWQNALLKLPAFKVAGTTCAYMFYNYKGTELDVSNFDTKDITSMSYMFGGCENLTTLNVSNFDTNNVTNMSYMFSGCSKLTSIDLSNFDTTNVTSMSSMFNHCSDLTELDLSNFNTSNVTNMANMFDWCSDLIELNLSNFDTTNITSLNRMFGANNKLVSLNISSFDMEKVTTLNDMFAGAIKMENLQFGINLGKGYTRQTVNYSVYQLKLPSTYLTHDSLMSVINNLYDLNLTYDVANGGTLYTQSLVLGADNLAKLTEEEIAIATNKGWTVS